MRSLQLGTVGLLNRRRAAADRAPSPGHTNGQQEDADDQEEAAGDAEKHGQLPVSVKHVDGVSP
jgi:hypothetical protein